MSLASKMLLLLIGQFCLLALAQLAIQFYFILPNFEQLENKHARVTLTQVEQRFHQELKNLNALTYDWSAWDDTYAFVLDRNQAYIDSNLPYDTFTSLGIDSAFILNMDMSIVWALSLDRGEDGEWQEQYDLGLLNGLLAKFRDKLAAIDLSQDIDDQYAAGYVHTGKRLFTYAARPITDSEGEQEPRGYILFLKHWNEYLHEEYESQLRISFDILPAELDPSSPISTAKTFTINKQDTATLKAQKLVFSNDQPAFVIASSLSRDITQNGHSSVSAAIWALMLVTLVGVFLLYVILKSSLLAPLRNLSNQMSKVSNDSNYSVRAPNPGNNEVGKLAKTFNKMLDIIEHDQHALQQTQQELQLANKTLSQLAKTDKLTGIANRLAMEEVLRSYWDSMGRSKRFLAILMIDIDYFKQYNDLHGHQQGDDCLRAIATVLSHTLERSSDFLARYGGEEFIILLPDCNQAQASALAEKLLTAVSDLKLEHGESSVSPFVSISIGVSAEIPSTELAPRSLIEQADIALYTAKNSGRNRYSQMTPSSP